MPLPADKKAFAEQEGRVFQQPGPHDWGPVPGSSAPVSPLLALVGFVGLCLLVGAAGATISARAIHGWYAALAHPPGTPPNWVFGPVWTGLYVLIGVSGWMVWQRVGAHRVLRLWGWQLAANALWVPAFFGLHRPWAGLVVLLVMLALLALTIGAFRRIRPAAAALLLPYFGWAAYATYLNAGIWILNRT